MLTLPPPHHPPTPSRFPQLELGDESLDSGRVSRKRFCVIDFPSHEQASAVAKALDGKTFMDAMGNLRRVHVGWWS